MGEKPPRDPNPLFLDPDEDSIEEGTALDERKQPTELPPLPDKKTPEYREGKYGDVGFFSFRGINYKPWNEDAVVVGPKPIEAFAVIDGVGGDPRGDQAAAIAAEAFKESFVFPPIEPRHSLEETHNIIHESLANSGNKEIARSGACYLAGYVRDKKLMISKAGDVRLIVARDGKSHFATADETREIDLGIEKKTYVTNFVSGRKETKPSIPTPVPLQVGDTIIIGSDSFYKYFSKEQDPTKVNDEIAGRVKGLTIRKAMEKLQKVTLENMKATGRGDNFTLLLYYIKRL